MKKLLKLVVVLVLLVVVAGVGVVMFLDQGVKAAVERGGTFAMGVDTRLGSADVGLLKGQLGLDSLRIANPPGFGQAEFMQLGTGELEIELGSLMKDTVVVPRLLLSGITIDLARSDAGTNFGTILANLQRFESRKEDPAPAPSEEGKKVLLKEIVIRDVTVTLDIGQSIAGFQNTSFTLPELVVTDLGTGGEGKPISEHFSDILQLLLDEVVKHGGGLIPPELLNDLKGRLASLEGLPDQLSEQAQEKLDQVTEEAKKKLDEVMQKGQSELEQQQQKLQDEAKKKLGEDTKKKLGDGLGDLWKKKDGDGK